MGNWQLEVFKLAMYVTFPVAMFYVYNQAELFEDWVIKTKRELYPPEHLTGKLEIEQCIREMREKQQAESIAKLQEELRSQGEHVG